MQTKSHHSPLLNDASFEVNLWAKLWPLLMVYKGPDLFNLSSCNLSSGSIIMVEHGVFLNQCIGTSFCPGWLCYTW